MVKVGIIGATGYAGVELVRLLTAHPQVQIAALSSVSFEGKALSEVYPAMAGVADQVLVDDEQVLEAADVVFASLPHGLSEGYAAKCDAAGKVFIDLGADFRLYDEADYAQWYGLEYHDKELHKKAVYALPELYRERIAGHRVIGNPGCYPTSIALGLAPLLKKGLIDPATLVIDSKSGTTGAGRSLSQTTHFPECNEGFSAYKVAAHRHTPEIEQTLSDLAGQPVKVTFVPHLLPVDRGILSTMYATLHQPATAAQLREVYSAFYAGERFVRILPEGKSPNIKYVRGSNFCDISLFSDPRTGRVIVLSAIDNMVKGAAGQAIQNMNIVCGFAEDTGLHLVPPAV